MLQWMDNFSCYGGNWLLMLDGAYASGQPVLVADPDPTVPPGSFVMRPNGARKLLTGPQTTVGEAKRIYVDGLPASDVNMPYVCRFHDATNTPNVTVVLNNTGKLQVYRGDSGYRGGVFLGETANVIVSHAWQHVECKVFLHETLGTVEIRVEGVTVLNLANLDTIAAGATCDQVMWGGNPHPTNGPISIYHKDLIIWDGSGATNNTFRGACTVVSVIPDGDVSSGWTNSSGANAWSLIDEGAPNDDVDYISAPTPAPAACIVDLTSLPLDVTSVKGVMSIVRSRKTDGGDGNLQASVVSGASTGNGADRPITSAYTYWTDMFEVDPATAAAWLPAAVNAMKLKLNRTV